MGTNVSNCSFYGVKWDAEALESVNYVAKGLLNLTELFKTQGINIECLIKIEPEKKIIRRKKKDDS